MDSMDFRFAIVKYPEEEDSTGVVPLIWLDKEELFTSYPNVTTDEKRDRLAKNQATPKDDWKKYPIKIMQKFVTYSEARLHLRESTYTSNFDSEEEEGSRKIRRVVKSRKDLSCGPCNHSDSEGEAPPRKKSKLSFPTFEEKKNNESTSSQVLPSSEDHEPTLVEHEEQEFNKDLCAEAATPKQKRLPSLSPGDFQMPSIGKKILRHQLQLEATCSELTARMIGIEQKLEHLCNILNNGKENVREAQDEEELAVLSLLPLQSKNDFEDLEKRLKDIPHLKKKLIKVFMAVGGQDIKHLSINIMRRLMTDSLTQTFSFTGKKGYKDEKKEAFSNTEVFKVIQISIRKVCKDYNEELIKKYISMWINQGKTRLSRRNERLREKMVNRPIEEVEEENIV